MLQICRIERIRSFNEMMHFDFDSGYISNTWRAIFQFYSETTRQD